MSIKNLALMFSGCLCMLGGLLAGSNSPCFGLGFFFTGLFLAIWGSDG